MNKHEIPGPPAWAQRLLKWYCPADSFEEVEGDLRELYAYWLDTAGKSEANRRYCLNVIRLQRPFSSRVTKYYSSPISLTTMIRHYILVASRNMLRSKAFSMINIVGLALGLACSLMIYLWVEDEKRVDNFHANKDRLYRVYIRQHFDGQSETGYNTPALLPAELKKVFPEIESATGFVKYFRLSLQDDVYETFQVGDIIHKMKGGRAEPDFFKMFTYPILYGSAETALKRPESLSISRKMAELYFGSADAALGQSVRFDGRKDLTVTAVFENVPVNSTDQFDYLMNWDAWVAENPFKQSWGHFGTSTYIQLRADANAAAVEAKIKAFLMKFLQGYPAEYKAELALAPFGDQYLYADFENGKPAAGRSEYVRLFSWIGVFILAIACINFMNLATARAVKRAKEVGVRKVAGSPRSFLIFQFMGEAILVTIFSTIIALAIAGLTLPAFNMLTGKQIMLPLNDVYFVLKLIVLMLVTGIFSGSYPALFLSSFQPVKILKGTFSFNARAITLRKSLVVIQFVLSLILLVATIVISQQINFLQTKNLGYDRENVIYIPLEGDLVKNYDLFRKEASATPGVKVVDRCSQFPHTMGFRAAAVEWDGAGLKSNIIFNMASVGYDFVDAMKLQIKEGRGFSRSIPADSMNFLVNEEAVRQMEIKDPIGHQLTIWGSKKGTIVGVLKDYHTGSLREKIDPLVLDVKETLNFGTILVRTSAGETVLALENLEKVWKKLNPDFPFQYSFMDQHYGNMYTSENIVGKLSNVFAFLAVAISCMGLLGLAMFSAEQRRKELSIRKILGASISNIITRFSNDFIKLVMVALIIAIPVSWFIMIQWLKGFAYSVELNWWMFALAAASTIALTMLTISAQAITSAMENPADNLRSE
ncbi:MAG TPA: ABC transporter permease [Ohtaekwangia sp.]|nr:ABC transporter permease [Ohtaekwangia sp.]